MSHAPSENEPWMFAAGATMFTLLVITIMVVDLSFGSKDKFVQGVALFIPVALYIVGFAAICTGIAWVQPMNKITTTVEGAAGARHTMVAAFSFMYAFVYGLTLIPKYFLEGASQDSHSVTDLDIVNDYTREEMLKGSNVGDNEAIPFSAGKNNWLHLVPIYYLSAMAAFSILVETHYYDFPAATVQNWSIINMTAWGWVLLVALVNYLASVERFKVGNAGDKMPLNYAFVQRGKLFGGDLKGSHMFVLLPKPLILALIYLDLGTYFEFFNDYGRMTMVLVIKTLIPICFSLMAGSLGVWLDYHLLCSFCFGVIYFFFTWCRNWGYSEMTTGISSVNDTYRWLHMPQDWNQTSNRYYESDTEAIRYFFSILAISTVAYLLYQIARVGGKQTMKTLMAPFNACLKGSPIGVAVGGLMEEIKQKL